MRLIRSLTTGAMLSGLFASAAFANHITTADGLRAACEQSPGNVVALDTTAIIGASASAQTPVATGCTLVLQQDAKLMLERVRLQFAGPLVIQSAFKTEVFLKESFVSGTSLRVELPAADSSLMLDKTTLYASTGALDFAFGDNAKMSVDAQYLGAFPGNPAALAAATTLRIAGGRKFNLGLDEGALRAPLGISIALNGDEGLLKLEKVTLRSDLGSVDLTASGAKALLNMSESSILFGNAAALRFVGSEPSMSLKQNRIGGVAGPAGTVTIQAGGAGVGSAKLEMSETFIMENNGVVITASETGVLGLIAMEKSTVISERDIRIATGAAGKTLVKDSRGGTGNGSMTVTTGSNGSCEAVGNSFSAAVLLMVCP